ncbi:MAG TPA: cytochrome c-type biogenesis protein [Noviherbaspirillum sp.]|nr:cytochrome c-type biogenesis protein [Noviherbaspirillum sp.]HJV83434.1 cytochrome c-type biogenesis protein [Noviherbaspirillum sp.]
MLVLSFAAQAKEAPPAAADPALEKRMLDLTEQLRCLVCQNQTIADSHAELAVDLKNQVREKLAAGMSDKDVINYMVERYGDFVLYKPPVKGITWLLWFGPFLLLVGGIAVLVVKVKGRGAPTDNVPEEELKRAASLLKDANTPKDKA